MEKKEYLVVMTFDTPVGVYDKYYKYPNRPSPDELISIIVDKKQEMAEIFATSKHEIALKFITVL